MSEMLNISSPIISTTVDKQGLTNLHTSPANFELNGNWSNILPCDLTELHTKGVRNPPAWWEDRPNFFIGPQLPLYPCIPSLGLL